MDELKLEYKKVNNELINISKELQDFEKDEKIIKYKNLKKRNEILLNHQFEIYKELKMAKYRDCNHILICSNIDYSQNHGRSYRNFSCIKCGLDYGILDCNPELLSLDDCIMYEFLKTNKKIRKGIVTNIVCDLHSAQDIYNKVLEENPNICDEEAIILIKNVINEIKRPKENRHSVLSRMYLSHNKIAD